MSDPLAVSILAKLTSWYTFDTDLSDAHGSNDIDTSVSTYSLVGGKKGSAVNALYGKAPVSTPISATSGQFTIGGWFRFTTGATSTPEFGLFYPETVGNEAFTIVVNPAGYFYVQTWEDGGTTSSPVSDPLSGATSYPLTIGVEDDAGLTAESQQVLRIQQGGAMVPGWYFVVASWDAGNRVLYVDSLPVASGSPPNAVRSASVASIGAGRAATGTRSITQMDECFVCLGSVLSADEVTWLYNGGAGRSYAELVAEAA